VDSVVAAIEMGYRAVDTAEAYRNEREVGAAMKSVIERAVVTREELFIATKLSDSSMHGGYEKVLQFLVLYFMATVSFSFITL